jgi:hypothetical protein
MKKLAGDGFRSRKRKPGVFFVTSSQDKGPAEKQPQPRRTPGTPVLETNSRYRLDNGICRSPKL